MAGKPLTLFKALAPLSQQEKVTKVAQSKDWFLKNLRDSMGDSAPTNLSFQSITKDKSNKFTSPHALYTTGKMYMFVYQAKTDAKLKYWDMFPLIFNIQVTQKGFLGINLHYLPFDFRARLFDAIYQITVKSPNDTQRSLVTYAMIKKVAKFSIAKPAIKHYLFTNVRSYLIQIGPENWETALYLPTDNWVRATNSQVWADTRDAITEQLRKKNP